MWPQQARSRSTPGRDASGTGTSAPAGSARTVGGMSRRFVELLAVAVLLAAVVLLWPRHARERPPFYADAQLTPGVLNPDVTQATIATTICVHGWTRTVRPPSSYTGDLKLRQMR